MKLETKSDPNQNESKKGLDQKVKNPPFKKFENVINAVLKYFSGCRDCEECYWNRYVL